MSESEQHRSDSDSKFTTEARKAAQETRDLLKDPNPDTFLGRKTHEPFPKEEAESD